MENNANTPAPQSALRKLRGDFSSGGTWAAVVGAAVILTLAGAFDTGELMPLGPRLAYWLVLVAASYGIGVVVGHLAGPGLARHLPHPAHGIVLGTLTGLAVTVAILAINLISFPDWSPDLPQLLALGGVVVPIAIVVTILLRLFERALSAPPATDTPAPPRRPRILSRLPLEKRGALLALSVEDHYVRVRTERGEDLVLMRLTDAIAEADPIPGLRVHRSHWVATNAVTAARREADRAVLTLSDATEIPVSRANIPAVREAGLLP